MVLSKCQYQQIPRPTHNYYITTTSLLITTVPVEELEGRGWLIAGMTVQGKVDVGRYGLRVVHAQNSLQDQRGLVLVAQGIHMVT